MTYLLAYTPEFFYYCGERGGEPSGECTVHGDSPTHMSAYLSYQLNVLKTIHARTVTVMRRAMYEGYFSIRSANKKDSLQDTHLLSLLFSQCDGNHGDIDIPYCFVLHLIERHINAFPNIISFSMFSDAFHFNDFREFAKTSFSLTFLGTTFSISRLLNVLSHNAFPRTLHLHSSRVWS